MTKLLYLFNDPVCAAAEVDEECPAGNAAPGAIKDVLTEARFAEINSNKDPVMRKSDSNKNIAGFR